MRAAAATGQRSRIRKLVKMGDMLPRPSGVLRRKRPNTIQGGAFPKVWNRVGDSDAEGEFTHSQTRAARVLFRDPVEFSCSSLAPEIRWHSLSWLGKRFAEGQRTSAPPYLHRAVLIDADRLGQAPHRDAQIAPIAQAARIRVVSQRPCHEALLLRYLERLPTTAGPNFPARALPELRQRLA
jgi:hypothetical protein